MANLVPVPPERLDVATLGRLLEEFCSRDGTDYGTIETPLEVRVEQLRRRLASGEAELLYDADSQHWDIVAAPDARALLNAE